ncbi:helicase-related protein [Arthrobacter sp. GMC3]|uniref:helicase-related protein n=1 Tax=Arthrobacter sp. GMC3 TaxID=2058894 RepID=UPI000CE49DC9|nr:helicase-related protein [Arthrobacter sp. GMC3]
MEVTLKRIRNASNLIDSNFLDLYTALLKGEQLDAPQQRDTLMFAVLFLRADDPLIQRLGYRVVLHYSLLTGDYVPLRDISIMKDFHPIVEVIETIAPLLRDEGSFGQTLLEADRENFRTDDGEGNIITRTRGQMELREFNERMIESAIVAPTSYGKSEMMLDKVANAAFSRTCIVVPTKALIAQTRLSLVRDSRMRARKLPIITHHDGYTGQPSFVAVVTQERLHRLLSVNPQLDFDCLLIDEAQGLLGDDDRSIDLSRAILRVRYRNPELSIAYYTPFISDARKLRHVLDFDNDVKAANVDEHMKSERLIVGMLGDGATIYDQFLGRAIKLTGSLPKDLVQAIEQISRQNTLVYVNKPKHAQELALRLSANRPFIQDIELIERAIESISELVDPRYALVESMRTGVLFHHGKLPDSLRSYVEHVFRQLESPTILVTTSTLLEGVNTPCDRLIVLSPKRGRANLRQSQFRNLIGRVARFSQIFKPGAPRLDLLTPEIHLIPGTEYAPRNWSVVNFLGKVADLSKELVDDVSNPLLEAADDAEQMERELEILGNIEPGIVTVDEDRLAQTVIGQACFQHGVHDFDIVSFEVVLQERLDERNGMPALDVVDGVMELIFQLFLKGAPLDDDSELKRLQDNEIARKFYSMILSWRAGNESLKRMIAGFLDYWSQHEDSPIYVGTAWGEETNGEGWKKAWVQMGPKSATERVNLAVVKVKEEQDFLDNNLMKYVDMLFELGLISDRLQLKIKYGTTNPSVICLLRNGVSPDLAHLVMDEYVSHISLNLQKGEVKVRESLVAAMRADEKNDVLIYEASTLVNSS